MAPRNQLTEVDGLDMSSARMARETEPLKFKGEQSLMEGDDSARHEGPRQEDGADVRCEPPITEPSEFHRLERLRLADGKPAKIYQGFSASDLPGVRFSHWVQFKNRFEDDDLSGISVEALIGPPNLRADIMVDDYWRTVSNQTGATNGQAYGLADFSKQPTNSSDTMIHRVRILSSVVRKRLSSLTNSSTDWTSQPVTSIRPFRELIFFHDKMKMELKDDEDTATRTTSFQGDDEELSNYINFVEKVILPLKTRWEPIPLHPTPKIRYVDLWYIFKPGDLMYWGGIKSGSNEQPSAPKVGMLVSVTVEADEEDFNGKIWNQVITTWFRSYELNIIHLDFDGRAFRPVTTRWRLSSYQGEKDIRSLPVYPLDCEPDSKKIVAEYQQYGNKFKRFCSNQRHWFHSGWTLDWSPPLPASHYEARNRDRVVSEFVDSEVIVDFQEALRSSARWLPEFLGPLSANTTITAATTTDLWSILTWSSPESTNSRSSVSEVVIYNARLEGEDDNVMTSMMPMLARGAAQEDELEDIHLALLPRRVFAYSLRDRKFVLAHVDSLSEVKHVEGGFKNLRINHAHLRMIKSLVKNHFNTKHLEGVSGVELGGQDFIYGKGRGVVVLLHGVPGVGKTATAEAVAQEYAKPLFPMTCGDLGTTPEVVSSTLLNIFRLANLWECVLLLDEADVFLSRREQRSNDLLRNALVSVFLRVLEYYSGILFLTTNRPGVLDEAVKSRVHASFFYPHLEWNQTRDIFELNIERLRRMEGQRAKCGKEALVILDHQIMKFAEDHFHKHNDHEGRWNGRQIRNAFQIAAGLAHLDGEEAAESAAQTSHGTQGSGLNGVVQRQLGRLHFQEVADAILKYDQFRANVLGKFDDEVAKDRMERAEEFPEGQSEGSGPYGYGGPRMRGDYGGGSGSYERFARYEGGGSHRGY